MSDDQPEMENEGEGGLDLEIEVEFGATDVPKVSPVEAYLRALKLYDGAVLVRLCQGLGINETPAGRVMLASSISEALASPRMVAAQMGTLPRDCRVVAGLFALTERTSWTTHSLAFTLGCLGIDFATTVPVMLERALLAVVLPGEATVRTLEVSDRRLPDGNVLLQAHPAVITGARTLSPEGPSLPPAGPVRSPRESDGLEPIIRMAALWQRVADAPLRQTQQGSIYKRDRERLEDDPVLAGPIADALEPLPDMPSLWLALAAGVGMVRGETGTERVIAAEPVYWSDNAFHLAQMVAQRWLLLTNWHEQGGIQRDGAIYELSLPYARPALLLWLATLPDDDWVATEDFARFLKERFAHWDVPTFIALNGGNETPPQTQTRTGVKRAKAKETAAHDPTGLGTLESVLLGPAYQFGLIRAAEEVSSGRRVVQLTPLGRYLLTLGPPPDARQVYAHFLFVQPNFEAIAYRQGLNPGIIGHLSRFTTWTQVGAALAFKITPESVYRGLEGAMTPQEMLDVLTRQSGRPLHTGLVESVRSWASRRQRVTYYAAATLIEFTTTADLEQALSHWPTGDATLPVMVSDRLLLVDGNGSIPFQRFRMSGSRDYRRPPEACVEVEEDGVSLTLDMARSDLLVDAELSRFATETAERVPVRDSQTSPRRRFLVSAGSLERAIDAGVTAQTLSLWFHRRTSQETPPAIRLLFAALVSQVSPLKTSRPLVLHTPTPDLLDGLAQHPDTRDLLGDRLGPTSIVIPEDTLVEFQFALNKLGLKIAGTEKK